MPTRTNCGKTWPRLQRRTSDAHRDCFERKEEHFKAGYMHAFRYACVEAYTSDWEDGLQGLRRRSAWPHGRTQVGMCVNESEAET